MSIEIVTHLLYRRRVSYVGHRYFCECKMKLTSSLCFLLSGYEADHPVPAGPAQLARHGGHEGLHRPALSLQSSAETSTAPPGEHHQVSVRHMDKLQTQILVKVRFRVNFQPLKLSYIILCACVQRVQHSRASGLGSGRPPLLHLLLPRLLSASDHQREPAGPGGDDGLLLSPPQLCVWYTTHLLTLKPSSKVQSVCIVADAVDWWLQVWSNVTSSGAPESGSMQRVKPRNTSP